MLMQCAFWKWNIRFAWKLKWYLIWRIIDDICLCKSDIGIQMKAKLGVRHKIPGPCESESDIWYDQKESENQLQTKPGRETWDPRPQWKSPCIGCIEGTLAFHWKVGAHNLGREGYDEPQIQATKSLCSLPPHVIILPSATTTWCNIVIPSVQTPLCE